MNRWGEIGSPCLTPFFRWMDFPGRKNENPYKHLSEIHLKCTAFCGNRDDLDNIKLILFPHTLGIGQTIFGTILSRKPYGYNQKGHIWDKSEPSESLEEYYERLIRLCSSCPNYVLEEKVLIDQFLHGMNYLDQQLLKVAAGGNLNNKTPADARKLIESMADGSQFGDPRIQKVNAMDSSDMKVFEARISANIDTKLNRVLKAVGAKLETKKCEICFKMDHETDECPSLQEDLNWRFRGFDFSSFCGFCRF
ncbi:hypothetical protein LUZ60_007142 [Juncus effusus]|nr:hypothetical protein LUZ60_007142 [Juncus effusus]